MSKKLQHRKKGHIANPEEERMLDNLSNYEEYMATIAPKLREAIKKGQTSADLFKIWEPALTARLITIAATHGKGEVALSAIKDLMDRHQGRPVEKKEVRHQLSQLKDHELDAMLLTVLDDTSEVIDIEKNDK